MLPTSSGIHLASAEYRGDAELIVEMRNQLPELIDYIKRLESAFIGIVSNEKHEGEAEKLIERLRSGEDIE